ncbi:MAG: cyclic nucleotide-binding domain-containing protein [Spirochaetia bacterium]|nr:cyclic nucleotide-binding domain-containing protein [Spirochaetia bacterium]
MAFQMVNFKAGSYCIIEGKRDANAFFIIRQGKVKTHKDSPVVGEEASVVLGPGDFFGVESAMTGHSRIETVVAATDVSLISVNNDQFGLLIQKNAPVAMKIIRSFSAKLRAFDTTITRLSFRGAVEEDPAHLFDLAEYYLAQQRPNHAAYAYQRYLQYCPQGEKVSMGKLRLQQMNKPLKAPPVNESSINRVYKEEDMIFCENEPGRELYIIQGGRVKITKMVDGQEVLLAVLQPGDIFGEMALLDNKPRSASAIVAENATMLAINKVNFETMVKAQPQLATLSNLMISDPTGRLFDMLLTLAEKAHVVVKPKASYNFEIGGKDLLKMVGFDPNNDERLLLEILKARWMKLDEGKMICLDLSELEKQVSFFRKQAAMARKKSAAAT